LDGEGRANAPVEARIARAKIEYNTLVATSEKYTFDEWVGQLEYWASEFEELAAEAQVRILQLKEEREALQEENRKLVAVTEALVEGMNGVTASLEATTFHIRELNQVEQAEGVVVYQ
jgi:hypothetical protein